MKAVNQSKTQASIFPILALALIIVFSATGCSPDPSAKLISPNLGAQLIAEAENAEVEIVPTPVPPKLADLSEEEIFAGLSDEFAALLASADPAVGEELALTTGCVSCHAVDPAQTQMVGPTWYHMGDTAVNRPSDGGPALYLYASILDPSDYLVDGYSDVMLKIYNDLLSEEDIANIVSYLLSLRE